MKVLMADDSLTMRKIAVQMLKQAGCDTIVEVSNGREALDKLQAEGDFDLLVTDWNMPQMNGLDLVQAVRGDDKLAKLPILMVTTRSLKKDIVAAMRAGVDNYVTKPFDVPTIKAKIAKVMG